MKLRIVTDQGQDEAGDGCVEQLNDYRQSRTGGSQPSGDDVRWDRPCSEFELNERSGLEVIMAMMQIGRERGLTRSLSPNCSLWNHGPTGICYVK